jgi:hypothetical protein
MLRPAIESLERRTLFTTYWVNTVVDDASIAHLTDGRLSLREAIRAANSDKAFADAPAGEAAGDVIRFADRLIGKTIQLDGQELNIRGELSIQGTAHAHQR